MLAIYQLTALSRVRTRFGKFRKLEMSFSRTWKGLEKRGFFKMAVEKLWIFVWKNSSKYPKMDVA